MIFLDAFTYQPLKMGLFLFFMQIRFFVFMDISAVITVVLAHFIFTYLT